MFERSWGEPNLEIPEKVDNMVHLSDTRGDEEEREIYKSIVMRMSKRSKAKMFLRRWSTDFDHERIKDKVYAGSSVGRQDSLPPEIMDFADLSSI